LRSSNDRLHDQLEVFVHVLVCLDLCRQLLVLGFGKDATQVQPVPLEDGPVDEDLEHTLDDFLDLEQTVKEVLHVRVRLQNVRAQEEFFELAGDIGYAFAELCLLVGCEFEFKLHGL